MIQCHGSENHHIATETQEKSSLYDLTYPVPKDPAMELIVGKKRQGHSAEKVRNCELHMQDVRCGLPCLFPQKDPQEEAISRHAEADDEDDFISP